MTEREEIDLLRRAVADLTERVRALETRPVWPALPPAVTPSPNLSPTWTLFGQGINSKCSCPPGTICMNVACPNRATVTCEVSNTIGAPS